ncbi:MAG: lipoprotein precursor [Bacteroidota bacterium]|nr:lipoprotein precursor [Bacteroidota bacterium]
MIYNLASYLLKNVVPEKIKMKKNIIISAILIASSIITLDSCKKKEAADSESQSVVDNAICEQQFMAITPVVNEKGINQAGIKKVNSCGTWIILGALGNGTITPSANDTIDSNADGFYDNGPVTFQFDYGTGCLSFDGVSYKTGAINITTAKRWRAYNNTVTIDLLNYKVNNVTYSGQMRISKPDSVTFTMEVINGHCTDGNWNIDYACSKTVKQIAGFNTKTDESDDVISIEGNSSGVNREGRSFSTSITSPLIKKSSCKWITSGTLDLTPSGFKARTVDYGAGGCDDDATYTVNGQTISFKLK